MFLGFVECLSNRIACDFGGGRDGSEGWVGGVGRRGEEAVERLKNWLIGGLFGGCQALYSSAIKFVASR